MKSIAVVIALAVSSNAGIVDSVRRRLSWDLIAGYEPSSEVFEHARIDLDQKKVNDYHYTDIVQAFDFYSKGAHSSKGYTLEYAPSESPNKCATTCLAKAKGDIAQCAAITTGENDCHTPTDTAGAPICVYNANEEYIIKNGYTVTQHTDDDTKPDVTATIVKSKASTGAMTEDNDGVKDYRCGSYIFGLALSHDSATECTGPGYTTADTTGCFDSTEAYKVGPAGGTMEDFDVDTIAKATPKWRTLQGMSTGLGEGMDADGSNKMKKSPTYKLYQSYYDSETYADDLVAQARFGSAATLTWAEAASDAASASGIYKETYALADEAAWNTKIGSIAPIFETLALDITDTTKVADSGTDIQMARGEILKKASAYLVLWMYTIFEVEDAKEDCIAGDQFDNDAPVHAADEAAAFYAGSLEGATGKVGGSGTAAIFNLAEKRAMNFGTQTGLGGMAKANENVISLLQMFKIRISKGKCGKDDDGAATDALKTQIVAQMTVPLIQGTIRYAFYNSESGKKDPFLPKEYGEGYAFAAAVLPQLHACDDVGANKIKDRMLRPAADAGEPLTDAEAKEIVQIIYGTIKSGCLGASGQEGHEHYITCADIGGLRAKYGDEYTIYEDGFEPCYQGQETIVTVTETVAGKDITNTETKTESKTEMPTWGLPAIIVCVAIALIGFGFACYSRAQGKMYERMYNEFTSSGGGGSSSGGGGGGGKSGRRL